MAEKLKDHYNTEYAEFLGRKIRTVYADFPEKQFTAYIKQNINGKEFIERQDVFADALELTLPPEYPEAVRIFSGILGPELETETGMFSDGWWLWPVGRYVERHGIQDIPVSLAFIKELTKRFTGEFALRPLLAQKPKQILRTVQKWSKDKNVHVRRLSSECLRIRLPWAKKIYIFADEFETCREILSNLRHDKSRFVQKSVGNNINDLYKEFPEKAEAIVEEWRSDNPSEATLWIINHGLRSTRKKQTGSAAQTHKEF
ncbi:DNA alkylation repair protein [Breznakiella homolactica]|uniref:DNA alkylation repair protein n=1 Tax=Breznakiella homolactica TaxID=2798577 RepID=A0A7T7XP69_9SPIR|nr:DNA alkylation repair protein [Breznakiella homolactica]QQO09955.1 DNA alkylation repair protein [Breznakiella homolactica]